MKGNNLLIYTDVSGTMAAVAASKTCDIDHQCDTIEVSSPESGQSRDFIPGRKSWSISCSGLLVNVADILNVGKVVNISVRERGTGGISEKLIGKAIITSFKETGSRGSLATANIKLQGSGDLKAPTKIEKG